MLSNNLQKEFKFFSSTTPSAQTQTLIELIANGRQEEAEILIQKCGYSILTSKTPVRDPSDRIFEKLTGFQYALWAQDFHMWTMLLKYLPKEDAIAQLQELEESGVAYEYPGSKDWIKVVGEKQFDFLLLIEALENDVNIHDELKRLPAHFAVLRGDANNGLARAGRDLVEMRILGKVCAEQYATLKNELLQMNEFKNSR